MHLTTVQQIGYAIQTRLITAFNAIVPVVVFVLAGLAMMTRLADTMLLRGPLRIETGADLRFSALTIVGFVVFARIAFYSLMDATVVPLNDDRHLFAANILGLTMVLLATFQFGSLRWWRRGATPTNL